MKTDREIYLNDLQKEMVKKAISDGKKCVITHDLMINIIGERIEVTNAHTGDVMRVMNWSKATVRPYIDNNGPTGHGPDICYSDADPGL